MDGIYPNVAAAHFFHPRRVRLFLCGGGIFLESLVSGRSGGEFRGDLRAIVDDGIGFCVRGISVLHPPAWHANPLRGQNSRRVGFGIGMLPTFLVDLNGSLFGKIRFELGKISRGE